MLGHLTNQEASACQAQIQSPFLHISLSSLFTVNCPITKNKSLNQCLVCMSSVPEKNVYDAFRVLICYLEVRLQGQ